MSERIRDLARALKEEHQLKKEGEEVIEVSAPAASAGSFYEKVRTAVEYQEEHLLRRNAIQRMLRRLLGADIPLEDLGKNILRELIWAKYLPNNEVPETFVNTLNPVIMKYEPLLRAADQLPSDREPAFSFIVEVMSTEIEYLLTPPVRDEALVSFMYAEMKNRIIWDPRLIVKDEDKDLRLYLAIHKVLLRSNRATLRFRLLSLYYPKWPGHAPKALIEEIASNLSIVIDTINKQMQNPVTVRLAILLRRKTGLFRVFRDILDDTDDIGALLNDPELLEREVKKKLKTRTKDFRVKLRRTVFKSILFIFLTKTLIALIMDVPYDLLVYGHISLLPLSITVMTPPVLLALLGLTITIPERKNEENYIAAAKALVVGADHEHLNVRVKRESFNAISRFLTIVYWIVLLFVYSVIAAILTQLNFAWISIITFLFFVSLVLFFAIRIRATVRNIIISRANSGLIGSIFDFFMLPVVRAGRWLSFKFSKLNVIIYFFDFIIESPVKVGIQFLEGWMNYVREQREEI